MARCPHDRDRRIRRGEIIFAEGAPADHMAIILEGEVRAEWAGDTRIYIGRAGQITGMLPYSRLTHYPSTGRAGLHTRLATLPKELFPEMLYRIPELGQRLVNVMSDRVREGTKADVQRDKLTALGKLSAGLAHELNNPASAVQRGAEILRESVARSPRRAPAYEQALAFRGAASLPRAIGKRLGRADEQTAVPRSARPARQERSRRRNRRLARSVTASPMRGRSRQI